jgi:hypothetical protein
MKEIKAKEDRLKEGVSLLTQLREANVKQSGGFKDLQEKISEWVKTGEPWDGTISFVEHGRVADVSLPKYNNKAAGLNFKVKK